MGTKKKPFFRIVVADSRTSRDGRFIEIIGSYNPTHNPLSVDLNEEKALAWLKEGAQPTGTVRNLLQKAGVLKKLVKK